MHQTVKGWCESVKMQENPAEEGKEVPFYDQKSDEGSWWFRRLKNVESFLQKRVGVSENTKKVMEQWSEMGLRVFRNGFGKRKR